MADLARACRQNVYVEATVPLSLKQLEEDPLAGELYDGELVRSLKSVPGSYWRAHPKERERLLALADEAYRQTGDADLRASEAELLGPEPEGSS